MITGKKILVVTTTDSMIGQFLLPHIKALTDAGNVVECACHKTGFWFDEMIKNGLVVYEVPFARNPLHPSNFKAQKKLNNIVKNGKYDLIHCHTPVGGVLARRSAHKFKIPVLYTAHGFHFFKGAPMVNRLVYKTIEKHYAKYTDALVVMNEEDFEAAKKMRAKRVYKISGIGLTHKQKSNTDLNALKTELGINEKDTVLISVGELNKNKNHEAILKALAQLRLKNVKYFVCGRGNRLDEYNEFINANALNDSVKFLGYRRDVDDLLKISDVFIMPSKREGLPLSMMEAMDVGLPIIGSDIRGCRDLIDGNGYLVDLKNPEGFKTAICELVNSPEKREKMAEVGKENIKKFYIENVLKQMEKIYDDIFSA